MHIKGGTLLKKLAKSIAQRGPLFTFLGLLSLAAMTLPSLPKAVVAAEEVPIKGTCGVTFTLTPTSPGVFGLVDDPHTATTKLFQNAVMGDRLTNHGKETRRCRAS